MYIYFYMYIHIYTYIYVYMHTNRKDSRASRELANQNQKNQICKHESNPVVLGSIFWMKITSSWYKLT